jgi:hypothetical protein
MNMQTVEQSRQIVADLRDRLAALEHRKTDLEQERDLVSLEAHTGNDRARTKLTKVNRELIEHDLDIASLEAALREAGVRVMQAEGVARPQIERGRSICGEGSTGAS